MTYTYSVCHIVRRRPLYDVQCTSYIHCTMYVVHRYTHRMASALRRLFYDVYTMTYTIWRTYYDVHSMTYVRSRRTFVCIIQLRDENKRTRRWCNTAGVQYIALTGSQYSQPHTHMPLWSAKCLTTTPRDTCCRVTRFNVAIQWPSCALVYR